MLEHFLDSKLGSIHFADIDVANDQVKLRRLKEHEHDFAWCKRSVGMGSMFLGRSA
jgi:hypothetical protein